MRAMVLRRQGSIDSRPLERVDLPDPEPRPAEIRVHVRSSAICRTDLHVIEGDLPPHRLPLVPGHQVVGVVDRLGTECRRFRPGDRVGIAWLRETCGVCAFCRTGAESASCRRAPSATGASSDTAWSCVAANRAGAASSNAAAMRTMALRAPDVARSFLAVALMIPPP